MARSGKTDTEAFAAFDHDHDGRPGGAPKGGNVKEAKMAKAATKKATTKRATTKSGDAAPETKRTTAAKSGAAEKLFKDADEAARAGLPPDMTVEQRETQVRRAALGF